MGGREEKRGRGEGKERKGTSSLRGKERELVPLRFPQTLSFETWKKPSLRLFSQINDSSIQATRIVRQSSKDRPELSLIAGELDSPPSSLLPGVLDPPSLKLTFLSSDLFGSLVFSETTFRLPGSRRRTGALSGWPRALRGTEQELTRPRVRRESIFVLSRSLYFFPALRSTLRPHLRVSYRAQRAE